MAEISQNMRGDGFVIENNIIKGDKKHYDVKEDNIGELFFNTLSTTQEFIGEIDVQTGKSKTFAEIQERCVRLATWMKNEGIGPGDVVSICTPRHPDVNTIFYATTFIGATFFPFSFQYDLETTRHQIGTLAPQLMFVHKDKVSVLEKAAALENHKWNVVVFDNHCNYKSLDDICKIPISSEIRDFQVSKVSSENICIVMPTSGTTGAPKLVTLDYKAMLNTMSMFVVDKKGENSNKIVLHYFIVESRSNYLISANCLLNRWTYVFNKDFDAHETFKIIEKYKITTLFLFGPKILDLINAYPTATNKYDLNSVTYIYSVGLRFFNEIRKRALQIFPNVEYIARGFSMTETCSVTSFTKKCHNEDSEGTVVPNVQFKIVDRTTGLALGHNQIGEICVKSPNMTTGYYKNPAKNKLAFDGEGWFHSGDEAYYDENGEVVVVGRSSEIIRYRDTSIYPLQIEQMLFFHPKVIDAAVIGIDDDLYNQQPVAYVIVTKGSNVTEEDLLKLMPKNEYDIFKNRIMFTDDFPRSFTGKILKRILKERAENYYKSHEQNTVQL